jgi:hypothetical protein
MLEISPDGDGTIIMSCAQAEFAGPVMVDVGGHFLAHGTYTRGTPIATIGPLPSVPANISGRVDDGGVLWLDIAIAGGYPLRSARLRRGAQAILMRCL